MEVEHIAEPERDEEKTGTAALERDVSLAVNRQG